MPNLNNAKKALRQSMVRAKRNAEANAKIAFMRRSFRKLIEDKKIDEATKLMSDLYQILDKAAGKKLLKPNTVARVKSRAMKTLQKLSK
jgi:small subunit ribosomal protein S20